MIVLSLPIVLSLTGCQVCPIGGGCDDIRYKDKDDFITGYTTTVVNNTKKIVLIGSDYDYLVNITKDHWYDIPITNDIILDDDFKSNDILKDKADVWPYPETNFRIVTMQKDHGDGDGPGFSGMAYILFESKDTDKERIFNLENKYKFPAPPWKFDCKPEKEVCTLQFPITGEVYKKQVLRYSSAIHEFPTKAPMFYQIAYHSHALLL